MLVVGMETRRETSTMKMLATLPSTSVLGEKMMAPLGATLMVPLSSTSVGDSRLKSELFKNKCFRILDVGQKWLKDLALFLINKTSVRWQPMC